MIADRPGEEESARLGRGDMTPPPIPRAGAAGPTRLSPWVEFPIILLVYVGAARLLSGGEPIFSSAVFWLPSGVGVFAAWRYGLKAVPLMMLAAGCYRLSLHQPPATLLPLIPANGLEALLAWLLLRYLNFRPTLARLRDVFVLVLTAVTAPMAGATWATGFFLLTRSTPVDLGYEWTVWWRQNGLGVLVAAPLLFTWATVPRLRLRRRTVAEVALGAACVWLFFAFVVKGASSPDLGMALSYLALGVALYGAVRYGAIGAATASAVIAVIGVIGSAAGVGPFAEGPELIRELSLQVFVLVLTTAPLMIGALIREREASGRARVRSEQAFLQAGADIAYLFDAQGTILDLYIPPGLSHPFQEVQNLVGRRITELAAPEVLRLTVGGIERALAGHAPEPIEYPLTTDAGRRTREARFVNFGAGKVLALVRDITDRRRAEQLLAWQTPVLEEIAAGQATDVVLQQITMGIESLTEDGICSVLVLEGSQLHVASAASLPDAYNAAIDGTTIGPDAGSCGTAAFTNRPVIVSDIATDPLWRDYREFALPHGLRACWSIPFHAPSGQVLGTLAVYYRTVRAPTPWERAILERGAALAGIAVERERREGLLESINRNVNEGIFRSTPNRGLVYINHAFARMFGYDTPVEMLAVNPRDLQVRPEAPSEILQLIEANDSCENAEAHLRRRDGSMFWGLVTIAAVRNAKGAVQYYDGAVTDITARKELEEELRQTQKMEAVGKLAGGVAHDFNNLLTAIKGYAVMLGEELPSGSTARGDVDEISRAASRAAGLTRQLLAYSRRQVLSPEVIDLRQVVDELGTMLRRLIGENLHLVTRHASRDAFVRVDRSQIEQVILNLVLNARDAMPAGGTVTVETGPVDAATAVLVARRHGPTPAGYVELLVSDTGAGMDEATLDRAFDPFFTTKNPGEGTGLGLSTVFGIVQQSGGSVYLESVVDAGTSVRVYLPLVTERPVPVPAPVPRKRRGGGTILIAEDEPQVRELTCRLLRQAGYAVLAAADGEEALQIARGHSGRIDLLLTDVIMPRLSGDELAARLLVSRPGVPVLFVSGYANETLGLEGMGPGTRYLQKPFVPAVLLECVEELLTTPAA